MVCSAACRTSDSFGKGESILDSAYALPSIGSLLPNKSDIGQQENGINQICRTAADQITENVGT